MKKELSIFHTQEKIIFVKIIQAWHEVVDSLEK